MRVQSFQTKNPTLLVNCKSDVKSIHLSINETKNEYNYLENNKSEIDVQVLNKFVC